MDPSNGDIEVILEERLTELGLFEKLRRWYVLPRVAEGKITLDAMQIHKELRGNRDSHRILDVFTRVCDEQHLIAELTVRPIEDEDEPPIDIEAAKERLFKLYAAHDFVRTGSRPEMNDMVRLPRT